MEEADAVAGDDGAGGDAGRLAAVTFASLGAYHRRAGDLEAALAMLQQALAVQDPVAQPTTAAATHLNLGATLLSLSDHRGALEQAQAAAKARPDAVKAAGCTAEEAAIDAGGCN